MAARIDRALPAAAYRSVKEEAAFKGVHPLTIRRAIKRGDYAGVIRVGLGGPNDPPSTENTNQINDSSDTDGPNDPDANEDEADETEGSD